MISCLLLDKMSSSREEGHWRISRDRLLQLPPRIKWLVRVSPSASTFGDILTGNWGEGIYQVPLYNMPTHTLCVL